MKIDKNSWHYRFLRAMNADIPKSLCPYFWKTLFILGVWTTVIVLITIFMYVIGDKMLVKLGWVLANTYAHSVVAAVLGISAVLLIVAIVLGCVIGGVWVKENFKPPYKEEPFIISFIKAKKSKICPTLEFVDKD